MNLAKRFILLLSLAACLGAQAPEKVRIHRWKSDIDAFASRYAADHPAPFRRLSKAEFERRVDELKRRLPLLKDPEIAAGWAKVVADLGDEHTEVNFDAEFGGRRLPVEIESYGEGTFIIGTTTSFRGLLGARLDRLVVDLRGNTGGSEILVDRLVSTLQKEPRLRVAGNLLVLTDGAVFSAAAVAAWRLRYDAGALLVGEACGASANHIGAVDDIRLPSGRSASYGTQIHIINKADPEDFSSPILPDLEVRPTHAEIFMGRDPVLEAALKMTAGE